MIKYIIAWRILKYWININIFVQTLKYIKFVSTWTLVQKTDDSVEFKFWVIYILLEVNLLKCLMQTAMLLTIRFKLTCFPGKRRMQSTYMWHIRNIHEYDKSLNVVAAGDLFKVYVINDGKTETADELVTKIYLFVFLIRNPALRKTWALSVV